jgi:hypothetical protein
MNRIDLAGRVAIAAGAARHCVGLTKSHGKALRGEGSRVNCVTPRQAGTDIFARITEG